MLSRQRQLLGANFFERYTADWLVWEPGAQLPARPMALNNTEVTHQPSAAAPSRPEGTVVKNAAVITAGDVRITFYSAEGFPVRLQHEHARR